MKFSLVFFLLVSINVVFAKKDTVVTYYGYKMNEIKKKDYCVYYRKTFQTSESTYGFLQFYRSGVLQMTGSLEINGLKKTGVFVYYSNKGVKIKEENYVKGLKEGEYKVWTDAGTLGIEGSYKNDKKTGIWKTWNYDGSLGSQGVYLNGEMEGTWQTWHLEGRIASEGNFKLGKKEGEWKYWFKNGSLDQEGVFIDDKREGDWVFYFESGKVSAKEIYENGEAIKVEFWDEHGNVIEPTVILEKDPEFPGGEMAMAKFIQSNIIYPELSKEMGEQGIVYVIFTVAGSGELLEIKILIGVSVLLDAESIRVVKKMPNWIPGYSHNRILDIDYILPINFKIS